MRLNYILFSVHMNVEVSVFHDINHRTTFHASLCDVAYRGLRLILRLERIVTSLSIFRMHEFSSCHTIRICGCDEQ